MSVSKKAKSLKKAKSKIKKKTKSANKVVKKKKKITKKVKPKVSNAKMNWEVNFEKMDSKLTMFSRDIEKMLAEKFKVMNPTNFQRNDTNQSTFFDFEKKLTALGVGGNLENKLSELGKKLDILKEQNNHLITEKGSNSKIDMVKLQSEKDEAKDAKKNPEDSSFIEPKNLFCQRVDSPGFSEDLRTLGPNSRQEKEFNFELKNKQQSQISENIEKHLKQNPGLLDSKVSNKLGSSDKAKNLLGRSDSFSSLLPNSPFEQNGRRKSILKNKNMNKKELNLLKVNLNKCKTMENQMSLCTTMFQNTESGEMRLNVVNCSPYSRERIPQKKDAQSEDEEHMEERIINENLKPKKDFKRIKGKDFGETLNNIYNDMEKTFDGLEIDKLVTVTEPTKNFEFNFEELNVDEMILPGSSDQKVIQSPLIKDEEDSPEVKKEEPKETQIAQFSDEVELKESTPVISPNQFKKLHVSSSLIQKTNQEKEKKTSPFFSKREFFEKIEVVSKKSPLKASEEKKISLNAISKFINPGPKLYTKKKITTNRYILNTEDSEKISVQKEVKSQRHINHYPKHRFFESIESDILVENHFSQKENIREKGIYKSGSTNSQFVKSERKLRFVKRFSKKNIDWKMQNQAPSETTRASVRRGPFKSSDLPPGVSKLVCRLFKKIIVYMSKLESLKLYLHEQHGESFLFKLYQSFVEEDSGRFTLQNLGQLSLFIEYPIKEAQLLQIWWFVSNLANFNDPQSEIPDSLESKMRHEKQGLNYQQFRLLFCSHRICIPEVFLCNSTGAKPLPFTESERSFLKSIVRLTCQMLGDITLTLSSLPSLDSRDVFKLFDQFESPFENKNEVLDFSPNEYPQISPRKQHTWAKDSRLNQSASHSKKFSFGPTHPHWGESRSTRSITTTLSKNGPLNRSSKKPQSFQLLLNLNNLPGTDLKTIKIFLDYHQCVYLDEDLELLLLCFGEHREYLHKETFSNFVDAPIWKF